MAPLALTRARHPFGAVARRHCQSQRGLAREPPPRRRQRGAHNRSSITQQDVADQLIRDLVDTHPDVMTVLAPYGIDFCCGGGHPLGEALHLHGIPREPVISEVARIVDARSERS